jgi:hypothetical protein
LVEKNVSYVNVIDQRPEFDAGQKMALNGVYFDSNVVLMLEVITETLGADEQLLLKVSYMDIEKIKEGDKVTGLKPTSMVSRSYLLRSSVSGDNPKTTLDLAYDFMAYLQAQGKFKE